MKHAEFAFPGPLRDKLVAESRFVIVPAPPNERIG